MAPNLILTSPAWVLTGFTQARGAAFDASGKLLRAAQLASLFDAAAKEETWLSIAAALNGSFAVVNRKGDQVRGVVDRLRSIPLFFASTANGLLIADDAHAAVQLLPGARIDPLCAAEFRLTGYVTGAQTLLEGLYQIRAGHCLFHAGPEDLKNALRPYFAFRHRSFHPGPDEFLIHQLEETHENVFRRLLIDLGDRPIVVPLSGGYDSRLIGLMLRDLGCRNVLCYSYGTAGNWEANISRELAEYLGFRWTMVPYSADDWRRWAATPEYQRYFSRAGNLVAVPHVQDWPAVYELKRRGEIPQDAVFVPGHSGDFLAGSHIPKWYPSRSQLLPEDITQSLFDVHFTLWDWPDVDPKALRRALTERIEQVVGPIATSTPEEAADTFECWDCQERQAKFIVNSVRVYESFGHEWRLPLFDTELMDYWSRVPITGRVGRRLYFKFVERHQQLPVTQANTDHSAVVAVAIRSLSRFGLRPLAKRAQRLMRRLRWRQQYEHGDLAWFALIDPAEFHALYTGREIGHAFLALKYLRQVTP